MSTVYLGTSDFAAAVLERLAASATDRPALVITRPDRPAGRGRRLSAPPVAEAARRLGLKLVQPAKVNEAAVLGLIEAAAPGERPTLVVCAFGALITEPLLSAFEIVNVHPSLLPRWRGAAPVERAIMAGDSETGVSIMRLTAGLDAGPICLQATERISPEDDYASLAGRLELLAGTLLLQALEQRPPFAEQASEGVTYAEKITGADRLLDPKRPAIELERTIRALHPHIGTRLQLDEDRALGIRRARVCDQPSPRSGELVADGESLLLGCEPGALELLEVQPPGGRAMAGGDYLRGHGAGLRR